MNSSQFSISSAEEDSRTPIAITDLLFSRSLATSGEKSESPERMTKVSRCSLDQQRSIASTARRMSALFFPERWRFGISIISIPAACSSFLYSG